MVHYHTVPKIKVYIIFFTQSLIYISSILVFFCPSLLLLILYVLYKSRHRVVIKCKLIYCTNSKLFNTISTQCKILRLWCQHNINHWTTGVSSVVQKYDFVLYIVPFVKKLQWRNGRTRLLPSLWCEFDSRQPHFYSSIKSFIFWSYIVLLHETWEYFCCNLFFSSSIL